MTKVRALPLSILTAAAVLSGCGGQVTPPPAAPSPTTFKVRLENVATFAQLKTGSFNTRVGGTAPGALKPGEAFEVSFTAGKGHKIAFATMFGASNDWVFATAPGGIDLYENGVPVSGDVTSRIGLYDVGTEIDEEPGVGAHVGPNQGTSTDGPGAIDPNPNVRKLASAVTLTSGATFNLPPVASMIRVTLVANESSRQFTLKIENVSNDSSTLVTSQGVKPVRISPGVWTVSTAGEPLFSELKPDRNLGLEDIAESGKIDRLAAALPMSTGLATAVSPGVYVVHADGKPLYSLGLADRGQGLDRIAEDGNVTALAEALQAPVFNTPVGKDKPGAATPGNAYEFEVMAMPGERLSFATMYGWSNDWFFATADTGLALFDAAGMPISGDATSALKLYDVGSELSEEPGVGANTGPQQSGPNTGPSDTDNKVREVPASIYGTPVAQHLKLTITPK
jgi:hypothetical protein